MTLEIEKYVLEHSIEQDQFHIQKLSDRRTDNGYKILSIYPSYKDAMDGLETLMENRAKNKPINIDNKDKGWYLLYQTKTDKFPALWIFMKMENIIERNISWLVSRKSIPSMIVAGPDTKSNLWDIGVKLEEKLKTKKGEKNDHKRKL